MNKSTGPASYSLREGGAFDESSADRPEVVPVAMPQSNSRGVEYHALQLTIPRTVMDAGDSGASSNKVDPSLLPLTGSVDQASEVTHTAPPAAEVYELPSIPFPPVPVAWYVRAVEVPIALAALTLSLPAILVIACVIRLGTPGPALFVQNRVGQNGRPFEFVKFRTLYADARQRFPELYAYKYDSEQLKQLRFKVENDPRVTPQGHWLRRTTLDELPNLWNVLTGDMALVGPRPEILEMLKYYKGNMLKKFTVRPGVTGVAQTSGRGRLGFRETVNYDLQYVHSRSLKLDLKILLKTARMVILRDGAF